MKQNTYHYTECGLNNVYLHGGFETIETEFGPATSVLDTDELHEMIGMHLVNHVEALSPDEVRFLRKEMLLSQEALADYIGVGESSVRNWESNRQAITKPATRVLKSLYLEYINRDSGIRKMLDMEAGYKRKLHNNTSVSFDYKGSGWQDECHSD